MVGLITSKYEDTSKSRGANKLLRRTLRIRLDGGYRRVNVYLARQKARRATAQPAQYGVHDACCLVNTKQSAHVLLVTPGDPVINRQLAWPVHHQVQQHGGPSAVSRVGIRVDKQLDRHRHTQ